MCACSVLADDVEETGEAEEVEYRDEDDADADMEEKEGGAGFIGGVKSEFLPAGEAGVKSEDGAAGLPKHAGDVKPGHAVPLEQRMTTSYMTKYERARILGTDCATRQQQRRGGGGGAMRAQRANLRRALPSCFLSF